ncbi:MAG: family 10 glycosylhydrolase [Gemmatimonadaceae bacterium]|nr:family 10 glycosylhydrolase [Gemmatimonadaceae bacterium]
MPTSLCRILARSFVAPFLAALVPASLTAQAASRWTTCAPPTCEAPPVSREFRAVWVAAVDNIDWPSRRFLSGDAQRAELIAILDRAQAMGLNAVILQVRPAGDALYASKLEPWSEYLTGRQGKAPVPYWDPLEVAVREAHARGLELHAWFNPYRAKHPSAKGALAKSHLTRRRPELVKRYGTHLWMDPGEPAVQAHTVKVVLDVVNRYDVDGIHLDDYFYPYKERRSNGSTEFPDDASFRRYQRRGGALGRDDWRRQNVDSLVHELDTRIHATKPWVKFGVSPFGIWRPGNPATVRGFDAYAELYADSKKWLTEGWLDYFTPQLYWPIAKVEQSYPVLLRWWGEQNPLGRHVWPGNFTGRVGDGANGWHTQEILDQVDSTRAQLPDGGNVHFSMRVFMKDRDSIATRLSRGPYATPALVPPTAWLGDDAPPAPTLRVRRDSLELAVTGRVPVRWWLVQTRVNEAWESRVVSSTARLLALPREATMVVVRAIGRTGVESGARALTRTTAP